MKRNFDFLCRHCPPGSGPAWIVNLLGISLTTTASPIASIFTKQNLKKNGMAALGVLAVAAGLWFVFISKDVTGSNPASDADIRAALTSCPKLKPELSSRTFSISRWTLQEKVEECVAIARQKAAVDNFKP